VLDRRPSSMIVRLVDKTNRGVEEEAEIPLEEVSRVDLPFVKDGSVFYWSIGYRDSENGQRARESIIVFRRLPVWTRHEIGAIRQRVAEQQQVLDWR
jgi:hypothetical protein